MAQYDPAETNVLFQLLVCRMGRLGGCNRCNSRVYIDPGCSDFSDYLLDSRGRLSDFVFRVDVRRVVWVAPKARLNSRANQARKANN